MTHKEYRQWCNNHNIHFYFYHQKHITTEKLETLYEDLIPHIVAERLTDDDIYARLAAHDIEQILKERNHVPTSESDRSPTESR